MCFRVRILRCLALSTYLQNTYIQHPRVYRFLVLLFSPRLPFHSCDSVRCSQRKQSGRASQDDRGQVCSSQWIVRGIDCYFGSSKAIDFFSFFFEERTQPYPCPVCPEGAAAHFRPVRASTKPTHHLLHIPTALLAGRSLSNPLPTETVMIKIQASAAAWFSGTLTRWWQAATKVTCRKVCPPI